MAVQERMESTIQNTMTVSLVSETVSMDLYTHMLPDKKEEEMMKFAELQDAVMNMADETAEKSFEKAKEREKERTVIDFDAIMKKA